MNYIPVFYFLATFMWLICTYHQRCEAALTWGYEDTASWPGLCQSSKRQSPIMINPDLAIADPALINSPIRFSSYVGNVSGVLFNSGSTIQFTISYNISLKNRPRIRGGGLVAPAGYIFEQLHLHWGNNVTDTSGAEHEIVGGVAAPAEIHLVHFNSRFNTLVDSSSAGDGSGTLSFRLIPSSDKLPPTPGVDYSQLTNYANQITTQDASTPLQLDLSKLLPPWLSANNENSLPNATFYKYIGSMATPPCLETVIWLVYQDPIVVPREVLNQLWQVTMHPLNRPQDAVPMVSNYRRPLAPLFGRVVRTNRPYNITVVIDETNGGVNKSNSSARRANNSAGNSVQFNTKIFYPLFFLVLPIFEAYNRLSWID